MNFSIGESITYGWKGFTKNLVPLIVVTLAVVAASVVLNLIGLATDNAGFQFIMRAIGWIFSLVISLGLIRVTLDIVKGKSVEIGDVFNFDGIVPYAVAGVLISIVGSIGLIFCIIPGLIVFMLTMFWGHEVVDRDAGIMDSITGSIELTKPNFGPLLGFVVVLFLMNIVGLLFCVVGLLVTLPVSAIATAHAYRTLRGQPVAAI